MKISCRHQLFEAKTAVQQAYKNWLLKKWYSRRNNLSLHQKLIHCELTYTYSAVEFDLIDNMIREQVSYHSHNQYLVQKTKLLKLITTKLSSKSCLLYTSRCV